MFWKRLIAFFTPSPGAFPLLWAALTISLALTATSIVLAISEPTMAGNAGSIISVCAIPLGVLLLVIATFIERKPGPRFLIWSAVVLLLVVSLGVLSFTNSETSTISASAITVFLCLCVLILGIPAGGWLFLGFKAYPSFRQMLYAARLQRVIEIIQARGEVTLTHLSNELSLNIGQTQKLVRELIAIGELMAYFDEENQIVYSAALLAEKQRRLLGMVNVKGKARIEELAAELKVKRGLVRQWIYALAERRQIHGFVDWAGGLIYSQDVKGLLSENRCPHCGGQLDVAGKGLIQCAHCAVEVFQ